MDLMRFVMKVETSRGLADFPNGLCFVRFENDAERFIHESLIELNKVK